MADDELRKAVAADMADARRRKATNRATINNSYQNMMGSVQDPADHPANNVSHPHGNRGRADATLSATPLSTPSTGMMGSEADDY